MKVAVECYAGYRGDETPRRLRFGDPAGVVEVSAVVRRWRSPTHEGFEVRCQDGVRYRLERCVQTGEWEAVPLP